MSVSSRLICARRWLAVLALAAGAAVRAAAPAPAWSPSWMASPQPTWAAGFVLPTQVPDRLARVTVREVARVSIGGPRVRVVLSNAYGREPLRVGAASVALPRGDGPAVRPGTLQALTFGGQSSVVIPPGGQVLSDPADLAVEPLGHVAVSVYLPGDTPLRSFHWEGRRHAWLAAGDATRQTALDPAATLTAHLLLAEVRVQTPQPAPVVVALGDSITDGAGSTLNADRRWPDFLAARVAPRGVAVLNAGISGARLLRDGMGVNALARLDRDVLAHRNVQSVIVLLGINDISWPGSAFVPAGVPPSVDELVAGYRQLIGQLRARGVRVIGATLTPFQGALRGSSITGYYSADKEALRQALNQWIRESGEFDAVLDADAALRDPALPAQLLPRFDSGDHLHPGDAGYRALAGAIDVRTLLP
ncbi:SGNH/GDSL hydrolase family protein [Bordetella petrii]|uniref:SGNH/GDSL hydrolase family protein n=1 Tax=Bordetella petrii TaxID=94624 RepID=UPI00372D9CAC